MKTTLYCFFLLAILAISDNRALGQYAWTKDARNPILSGAGNGTWNKHVRQASVLFNADSARYEMWFNGSAGPVNDNWRPYHIGFAVSGDGITWTMHPIPVLSPDPGAWDEYTVEIPMVIRENGQYKMWYTSCTSDLDSSWIRYATSPDGITWTKHPDNPVLGIGNSAWEAGGPFSCGVMPVAGGYKMWYGGYEAYPSQTAIIGYATSVDGIVWQKDTLNNPVLKLGAAGKWDDHYVLTPQVQYIDYTYYMWYTGAKVSSGAEQIGLAISPDGIVWTKSAANPVLALSPGQWDASYVEAGMVLLIGDTLHMWYTGGRNPTATNLMRIGHATLPLDTLLKYTVVGIHESGNAFMPEEYALSQNYPNPFNPITTIQFEIPVSGYVSLKVFNVTGQEVVTLVNKQLSPGTHKIEWNAAGFASGLYLYRLETEGYIETKKLILMK